MPRRPCIVCGALTLGASYCPAHTPKSPKSPSTIAGHAPGWRALRARALRRDGHACRRCGHTAGLAAHHVVPVAEGGTNSLDNLLTLCGSCHRGAHGPPAA